MTNYSMDAPICHCWNGGRDRKENLNVFTGAILSS
uniref:Uncharacterized protein n=1 Tax=Arundo donax TaxID=35708 RepID=A0A0A9GYS4_ARUDO